MKWLKSFHFFLCVNFEWTVMTFSRSVGLPFSYTLIIENLWDIPLPDVSIF